MTASYVQDAGDGVGEHGNSQWGGGCEYGREFVTPVCVESPACGGGPNETEAVLDCAIVDEVISGLVFGWACHVESLLVKCTGFRRVSYIMGAKNTSISMYYNTVCYKTQEGEPSICAARGVFQSSINELLRLFGELREEKFFRVKSRP